MYLQYALSYAKIGIAVFPLKPNDKIPLISKKNGGNGVNDATTDEQQIREWWTAHPAANIGLAMGAISGLFAVDVDGPTGEETLSELIKSYGPIPDTWIHQTPNGRHLIFRHPGRRIMTRVGSASDKTELKNLDCRGDGGYIVGAPSIHPSGAPYQWHTDFRPSKLPAADAPEWLSFLFEYREPEHQSVTPSAPKQIQSGNATRYGAKVLQSECDRIRTAPVGYQESTLNERSFVVGQFISGGEIDETYAVSELVSAGMGMAVGRAHQPWTETTVRSKVTRAIEAGKIQPKSAPERIVKQKSAPRLPDKSTDKSDPALQADPVPEKINEPHFKFLGFEKSESGVVFVFFVTKSLTIIKLTNGGITSGNLLLLHPSPDFWETNFPSKRGGVDMQSVTSWIIANSYSAGMFDESSIRGRGAWIDENRVVIHAGDHLVVNGKYQQLQTINSRYMYEQAAPLPFTVDDPLPDEESSKLSEIARLINFERVNDAHLLVGWCIIAPVCGALSWRPHLWITGGAGTGKTWVLKNFVRPLLGPIAVVSEGGTTEAGLRQMLYQDALPVVFDEADTDDRKDNERIQQVLTLMRISSSSDGGGIIKGSSTGNAVSYRIRSCFVMASIVVQAARQADRTRITVLNIRRPLVQAEGEARWKELQRRVHETLTPDFCRRLQARTILHLPTLVQNARTLATAIASEINYQRTGDQLGILIAGAHLARSTELLTMERAIQIVRNIDFTEERSLDEHKDEFQLLQHLCDQIVSVDGDHGKIERSIGEMIIACRSVQLDNLIETYRAKLGRCGIKPTPDGFIVSNQNDYLKRILKDTPWANGHPKILSRIDGAEQTAPVRFPSGIQSRGILIPYRHLTAD